MTIMVIEDARAAALGVRIECREAGTGHYPWHNYSSDSKRYRVRLTRHGKSVEYSIYPYLPPKNLQDAIRDVTFASGGSAEGFRARYGRTFTDKQAWLSVEYLERSQRRLREIFSEEEYQRLRTNSY